jgi:hypothetical protein
MAHDLMLPIVWCFIEASCEVLASPVAFYEPLHPNRMLVWRQ